MSNRTNSSQTDVRPLTAAIVSAFVGRNRVSANKVPEVIETVHTSLQALARLDQVPGEATTAARRTRRSVTRDHIICLEDGKRFRSLRRHLRAAHGMSPSEYRSKWRLSAGYPLVAPGYSQKRSRLAKKIGLGRQPNKGKGRRTVARNEPKGRTRKAA